MDFARFSAVKPLFLHFPWPTLLLVALLALPGAAQALEYAHSKTARHEQLRLTYDAGLPTPTVARSGEREIRVEFPVGAAVGPVAVGEFSGGLLQKAAPLERGLRLELSTSAFGFVVEPGQPGVTTLRFFRDALGARWKPAAKEAVPTADKKSPEVATPPEASKANAPEAKSAPAASRMPEPVAVKPAPSNAAPTPDVPAATQTANPGGKVPPVRGQSPAASAVPPPPAQPDMAPSPPSAPPTPETSLGLSASGPQLRGKLSTTPLFDKDKKLTLPPPAMPALPPIPMPTKIVPLPADKVAIPAPEETPGTPATVNSGGAHATAVTAAQGPAANATVALPPNQNATAGPGADPEPPTAAQTTTVQAGATRLTLAELLQRIQALSDAGEHDKALAQLKPLAELQTLSPGATEEILYALAEAQFKAAANDLPGHAQGVLKAFDRAINFNPTSPRIPTALLNMGLVHLKLGNVPEATGYFNLLRKRYPRNPTLPAIPYAFGQYYFDRGDYKKAADEFQTMVQKSPDHPLVQGASLGLARSLAALGYDDQALKVVEDIQRRWPRLYLDAPDFLRVSGDLAHKLERLDQARQDYWTYYNLVPEAEEADLVLARIGDIYLRQKRDEAARELFGRLAKLHPDKPGGYIAEMRLAEEGIFDNPQAGDLQAVFGRPEARSPEEAYKRILDRAPDSGLAPLARLKLAIWRLWRKDYDGSLATCGEFFQRHPQHPLTDNAQRTALAAAEQAIAAYAADGNYARLMEVWDKHAFLSEVEGKLSPEARLGLAVSAWKTNQPARAGALVQPLLADVGKDQTSRSALSLALNLAVERGAWNEVVALAAAPGVDKLPDRERLALDYAHALALVNLGETTRSRPLWTKLAARTDLDPAERAYALFYLARFAGEEGNAQNQYAQAQEALALFAKSGSQDQEKMKDALNMLVDVTQRAGRTQDAMRWSAELGKITAESDSDWPAQRFRLATLYQRQGDMASWRKILEELVQKRPDTMYGRLAKTALESAGLEEKARQYTETQP